MLPTLSQREEVSFVEKGQRIQRKDDLKTCIQKKYREYYTLLLLFNILLFMSLRFHRTFAQFQMQAYTHFFKPDKCFSLFLVSSEF